MLDQVTAYYQPVINMESGAVAGVEALARYIDKNGVAHSIGHIIEAIENDHELLEKLTRRLFSAIQEDIVPLFGPTNSFYVSANVPPAILCNRDGNVIMQMLHEYGMRPHVHRFVCELTERQALGDAGREALEIAHRNQIRLAVDDFGMGHNIFSQLLGLNIDVLKLDRSQVALVTRDFSAERLVRGIIAFGALLHSRIVAEGVETPAQAFFLQAAGVDYGQGWFWSHALPAPALSQVLSSGFPSWRFDLLGRMDGSDAPAVAGLAH